MHLKLMSLKIRSRLTLIAKKTFVKLIRPFAFITNDVFHIKKEDEKEKEFNWKQQNRFQSTRKRSSSQRLMVQENQKT